MSARGPSSITTAPTIETQRLRAHRRDDLPDCLALWSDPRVTRFIDGTPSTAQRAWARLLVYVGHWAVETLGSGEFLGDIGLADFQRDDVPLLRTAPELGFALAHPFHGKG